MRILLFIESLRSGGKERRLVELLSKIKDYPDCEFKVVLTRPDIHYQNFLDYQIPYEVIERKGLKKDPRLFFKFYRVARNFQPDIIHVWGNMVAIYAIPTKLLLRVPMINNQIADAPQNVSGRILSYKITFVFSYLIVANSYAGLKAYNAPKNKSKVIYNGFNFNRITNLKPQEIIRKKFHITTKYVVGMVASFSGLKNYATYIEAANQVLQTRDDVTFLCVGAGDSTPYKKMVIKDFGDKIKFLGKQQQVESIMNICDVGVLSTYTEGISNAIMEFLALGKPVVATDGGGTSEIIEDGINGYLIPPRSSKILAQKMDYLLNHFEIRLKYGQNGINTIKTKFSLEKMEKSFYKIYQIYDKTKLKKKNTNN